MSGISILSCRWYGDWGHFEQAESSKGLTYLTPTRTATLGMIAGVLGFDKYDWASQLCMNTKVAITLPAGTPTLVNHKEKMRKDSYKISRTTSGDTNVKLPAIIQMEMLWKPDYMLHISFPEQEELFVELVRRIQEDDMIYCPALGNANMFSSLDFVGVSTAEQISEESVVKVDCICPAKDVSLTVSGNDKVGIMKLRMPRDVTNDRTFSHETYLLEHKGNPYYVKTNRSWRLNGSLEGNHILFM